MRCPKCMGTTRIDVQALVYVRLLSDGTDADASNYGDHEWDDESAALCACGFHGKVHDFSTSQCQGCGKTWNAGEMMKRTTNTINERTAKDDAGDVGECPECGDLCYQME